MKTKRLLTNLCVSGMQPQQLRHSQSRFGIENVKAFGVNDINSKVVPYVLIFIFPIVFT